MSWELNFRAGDKGAAVRFDDRTAAIIALTDYLLDAGVTVADDPTEPQRRATEGGFAARFLAPDGTRIVYEIRQRKDAEQYLNLAQFEERIGMSRGGLSKFRLPDPDVVVGPIDDDGSIPRGTVRGWTAETIDEWNDARPGPGRRSDLIYG